MGGQIAVTMDNIPPYLPQVKAGKIRALAISTGQRSPAVPDLPTVAESGVRGYSSGAWFGLLAPAATPKDVVAKLSAETARILQLPDVKPRLTELGAEPIGNTPAQFSAHIKAEIAKWAKVIKDANVELQ
jgi:tripartite-type tricarboxylate transporter receptor subunit TctC